MERDEVQRLKSENFYLKNLVYKLKEVAKEHNLDLKNYTNVDLENPNDQIFSLSERVYVLQVGKQINKLKFLFILRQNNSNVFSFILKKIGRIGES